MCEEFEIALVEGLYELLQKPAMREIGISVDWMGVDGMHGVLTQSSIPILEMKPMSCSMVLNTLPVGKTFF